MSITTVSTPSAATLVLLHPDSEKSIAVSTFVEFVENPGSWCRAFKNNPEAMVEQLIDYFHKNPRSIVAVMNWLSQPSEGNPLELIMDTCLKIQREFSDEEWVDMFTTARDAASAPNLNANANLNTQRLLIELCIKAVEGVLCKLRSVEESETRNTLIHHFSQVHTFCSTSTEAIILVQPAFAQTYLENEYNKMQRSPQSDPISFKADLKDLIMSQSTTLNKRVIEVFGVNKPIFTLVQEYCIEFFEAAAKGMSDPIGQIIIEGYVDLCCEQFEANAFNIQTSIPIVDQFQATAARKWKLLTQDRPRLTAFVKGIFEDPAFVPAVKMGFAKINILSSTFAAFSKLQNLTSMFISIARSVPPLAAPPAAPAPLTAPTINPKSTDSDSDDDLYRY